MNVLAGCPAPTGPRGCLPHVPWENMASRGSFPTEVPEPTGTGGLADNRGSERLGGGPKLCGQAQGPYWSSVSLGSGCHSLSPPVTVGHKHKGTNTKTSVSGSP